MLTERTPLARKAAAIVKFGSTGAQEVSRWRKTNVVKTGNFRKLADKIDTRGGLSGSPPVILIFETPSSAAMRMRRNVSSKVRILRAAAIPAILAACSRYSAHCNGP